MKPLIKCTELCWFNIAFSFTLLFFYSLMPWKNYIWIIFYFKLLGGDSYYMWNIYVLCLNSRHDYRNWLVGSLVILRWQLMQIQIHHFPELNCCNKVEYQFSLDETHLIVVRGLIHQEVSPRCVNEESSTERRSHKCQVNRSPQL